MKFNDIIEIAKQVCHLLIQWGIGGFLIIFGCLTMALGKQWFQMNWPDFMLEGLVEILLGIVLVVVLETLHTRKEKPKNGKTKKSN